MERKNLLRNTRLVENLLSLVAPFALALNKVHQSTKEDFVENERTGQCHVTVGNENFHLGISYVPKEMKMKPCYAIGSTKHFSLLIKYPQVITTREMENTQGTIFRGGVAGYGQVVACDGFHPELNEAIALLILWVLYQPTVPIGELVMKYESPACLQLIHMAGGEDMFTIDALEKAEMAN